MNDYTGQIEKIKANNTYRSIKDIDYKCSTYIIADGKKMINLSSNDYLNISTNEYLRTKFMEKYRQHPEFLFSAASARLLTGTSKVYGKFENNIASMMGKEAGLLFNSGYQCNQSVISGLFSKGDLILSDKLNHASIVAGLKLSEAEHFRYNHRDYEHLEKILKEKRAKYANAVIISESVFSMDGDMADIKKLIELKKKYNCLLMLDEAHAFGVFGQNLSGLAAELGLLNDIDILTVTFGKALGSVGAMCLSDRVIIEYLINKASGFIFSTALPSINVLWSNFLIEEEMPFLIDQQQKLRKLMKEVHSVYKSTSSSQIIPIIMGSAESAGEKAAALRKCGYYVLPINPPTVPVGTSRIRISLTADIEFDEIRAIFNEV